jgi:hypothetical protein
MHITRKLILAAVAMLAAGAAMAHDRNTFAGQPFNSVTIGPVAELTSDDRARFRERWREMPPEKREVIRDRLRQDWQGLPPEDRQKRRQELMERMRDRGDRPSPARDRRDEGFGQGYGTR